MRHLVIVAWFLCAAGVAAAGQNPITPPPNILLPNGGGVPPGQTASLEAGAFVARADDSSANWHNPAGLARASVSSVSATGGAFQFTKVSMNPFPDAGGSLRRLPAVVGALFKPQRYTPGWTYGFSIIEFNAWDGSVATELVIPRGTAQERFGYVAGSKFERRQASIGAAHEWPAWRFGFALSGEETHIEKDESANDVLVTPTGTKVLLGSSKFSGTAIHGRLTVGVQHDLSKHWKIGVTVRSPGVAVYKTGVAAIDGVSAVTSPSVVAYFSEPSARFQYKVPLQGGVGLAYVGARFEAEVSVRPVAGHSAYSMFASDKLVTVVTDDGRGGAPVTQTMPWEGITSSPRGFMDTAIGGHVTLTESGVWKLHFGAANHPPPVTEADQAFNAVTLHTATLGLSGQLLHFQASLGVRYEYGTSSDFFVRSLASTTGLVTSFKVRNLGGIYSIVYRF